MGLLQYLIKMRFQNQGLKTGSFAATHGAYPHSVYIYIVNTNLTNLTHIPAAGIPVVGKGMTSVTQLRWFAAPL